MDITHVVALFQLLKNLQKLKDLDITLDVLAVSPFANNVLCTAFACEIFKC